MSCEAREVEKEWIVLVARKGGFDLPTACPTSLPVYLYLRFANINFKLEFDLTNPDSDHVPYVEYGDCVLFNNEKGGVIEGLKEEKIADLDAEIISSAFFPDWLATKALVNSWLEEALLYELWLSSTDCIAYNIFFSDLPWVIRKVLCWKQTQSVKQRLGITDLNADEKEEELYRKADDAYEALSQRLGDQTFFFESRPTSLDAIFLGHALFVLHALPDTSVLRGKLLKHNPLVRYAENLKAEYVDSSSSSSSIPKSHIGSSTSASQKRASTYWSSKPKSKGKKEKTEEEKTFRRRAKYFLATQVIGILVFLSLFSGVENDEDADNDGLEYDD